MNAPATNRLDYLDAVRAFALLLGIVFHASLSFMPIFIGWAVMDISTSSIISTFVLVSHSFRMELFFLIAGFFSHMTYHRKGSGAFIHSRIMRIAVPFVLGWFILKPLILSSWVMGGESMRGEVNILNGLKVGFLSLGQLPKDLLTGSHLWFLYYLLLITGLGLVFRAVLRRNANFYHKVTRFMDGIITWISHSPLSLLALGIPTAACLWFMSIWGMDTPDKSLVPHWPVLIVYGGFFSLGWLFHRQKELMERFTRLTAGRFTLAIISTGVTLALSTYQTDMGHPWLELIRAGFVLSYAVMMWSFVCLTIGLFKRYLDKPKKWVRYLADASYWLYLIHLPIVVWLQIAFAELPFHWSLKLVAVSLLTVGISLVLYDLFVRSTWIGHTLNGQKKNRVLFNGRSNRAAPSGQATSQVIEESG